ncbi:hypothetical protein [Stenotrophomonas oahuensis]|uniref:Alanine acetyltransferase n=1 Tax=Stenotrophomonas oahuensis TaxID=3003271 RepID=A0ABY9YIW4_9GAMM|nr:hypothetical protein [Stenotrophomonas sp. A5586]WNH50817.1 hypothetical protein PDM29_10440 [Stenotrophomonas sp. A5586]
MSLPATPPLWTSAQQSWLQAMGYTVFVDGSVEPATPEPAIELTAVPADARAPRDPGTRDHVEPGLARLASPSDQTASRARPGSTPPSAPETAPRPGTRRPAVRLPDRLQIALLRASGCNPNDPETQALMASWNLDELRRSASAKRALWPQLRALRKRSRA